MHVYFHVPFCARRCSYCDFAIAVRPTTPADQYVAAVSSEWHERRRHPAWIDSPLVETIYFGGGTPSRLPAQDVARLVAMVADERPIASDAEITLEANPEDVTPAAASAWRAAGVTRLSLGAQSFDDGVLRWMHRTHDSAAVSRAVLGAREAGFDDLSLDLIFGLPPALGRDWSRDLDHALELAPDHLSFYGLTVEAGTPLARWIERGHVRAVDDHRYATEYLAAHATITQAGFDHYEVSNAAQPGRRARHNSAYWTRDPYLGLGPSAHSAAAGERWWNVRDWAAYARAVERGEGWVAEREQPDTEAIRIEELYVGLRTTAGVAEALVPESVGAAWIREGWALAAGGRIRLTVEGWLRLDALVAAV